MSSHCVVGDIVLLWRSNIQILRIAVLVIPCISNLSYYLISFHCIVLHLLHVTVVCCVQSKLMI